MGERDPRAPISDDESSADILRTGGTGGTAGTGIGTETGGGGGTVDERTRTADVDAPPGFGEGTPEAGRARGAGIDSPDAGDSSSGPSRETGSAPGYGGATPETGRPAGDGMGLLGR